MKLASNFIPQFFRIAALVSLLILNGFILHFFMEFDLFKSKENKLAVCETSSPSLYGFDSKYFQVVRNKIKNGQLLPSILSTNGLDNQKLNVVLNELSQHVNFNSIRAGNEYAFVYTNECLSPDYFVYQTNPYTFLISNLNNNGCVEQYEIPSETKREYVGGIIHGSLWESLDENGISINIIDQMEDALASAVDFYHVQEGNSYKLIFDRLYINGEASNNGKLIAAYFQNEDKEDYAIAFTHENKSEYFDLQGRPTKKSFLKAPVRFSRISSGFTQRRFHPVLKYSRPHLGTDYAAAYGTPIMAVGAGVVTAASYTGGNGKFVKIRHDKMYETQYLHMSRFANGIHAGSPVSQGQIIGYVGSTGLATGPHVCFRFWKNGIQVDHRKLNFASPDPLPASILPEYFIIRDEYKKLLDNIQFVTAYNSTKTTNTTAL